MRRLLISLLLLIASYAPAFAINVGALRAQNVDIGDPSVLPMIFEFDVVSTQTISGVFSTTGTGDDHAITVDWGDGGATSQYAGTSDQAYSKNYGSAGNRSVKIYASSESVLTKYTMTATGANVSFDLDGLPSGLTFFYCSGANSISGDLSSLPYGLTIFTCAGTNSISGDLSSLPPGMTSFVCSGANSISGDLSSLPYGLTIFTCSGTNTTVSGDLSSLPPGMTSFYCAGTNTISDYTSKTWTTKPSVFNLQGTASLSQAEVDQLFIDFDDDLTWASGNAITIKGSCAAPSSTSAAARARIISEGATISTN